MATDVDVETLTYGITGGAASTAVIGGISYDIALAGNYGTVYIQSSSGLYVYQQDLTNFESLDDGESASDIFNLTVTDGDDAIISQTYTINFVGTDDAPTLNAITIGTINEDAQASTVTSTNISGQMVATDIDEETLTYGINTGNTGGTTVIGGITYDISLSGTYGDMYVQSSTGLYVYQQNGSSFEALDDGESGTDIFNLTVTDGDDALVSQTFTINVIGSDDAPTINAMTTGTLSENDQTETTTRNNLSGQISATDIDEETLTYGISGGAVVSTPIGGITYDVALAGSHGTAYVQSSTGLYVYIKHTATVEAMDDDESASDNFTITVTDGDHGLVTTTYTVNIIGTDDVPTLNVIDAGTLSEDDQATTTSRAGLSGQLVATDVDIETLTYGITGGTTAGTDVFDGVTYDVSLAGTFGTAFVQSSTGLYYYHKVTAAVEEMDDGESDSDNFVITVTDGDDALISQTYTVTILGSDDIPTLNAIASGTIAEDDQATTFTTTNVSGQLVATDVDIETLTYGINGGTTGGSTIIDGITYDVSLAGAFGTAYVQSSTGLYVYQRSAGSFEAMDDNESNTDVFTLTVADGDANPATGQTFSITIVGSDDAPTLNTIAIGTIAEVDQSTAVTELNLSGQLAATDVDVETLTYGITGGAVSTAVIGGISYDIEMAGSFGTAFVQSSTGLYVYVKDIASLESMDQGETGSDTFVMTVTDGDDALISQTLTVNVAGSDDIPSLNAINVGTLTEDDQTNTTTRTNLSGQLVSTDVDIETLTYGINGGGASTKVIGGISYDIELAGSFGTAYVQSSTGLYVYVKDTATVEAMDDTESGSDVFTLTVGDGDANPLTTTTFTVNVLGSDDAPTLNLVTAATISEVDQSTAITESNLSGQLVATDVDIETLTYGINGGTTGGTDVVGGITYDVSMAGSFGTAYVQSSTGLYVYVKDIASLEALDDGESGSDAFTMTVTDGDADPATTQTFTVNIFGSDDRPTLDPINNGTIAEVLLSTAITSTNISGQMSATDIDEETLTYGINGGSTIGINIIDGVTYDVSMAGDYGTAYVQSSTGLYVYQRTPSILEVLDDNESNTDTFVMTVSDGDDGTVNQTFNINIVGSDDAPSINIILPGLITENDQLTTTTELLTSGQIIGTDIDLETLTYGISGGTTGGTTVVDGVTYDVSLAGSFGTAYVQSSTGLYVYVKHTATVEALDDNESGSDIFDLTVSDGDLHPLVTTTFTVNVVGSDDRPNLNTISVATINEVDQSTAVATINLSGQMVATDVDIETLTYGISGGAVGGTNVINGVTYDVSLIGTYGTAFVQSSTGLYIFQQNTSSFESLDDGESATDQFSLTVMDGDADPVETQTYTINLVGTDDAPTLNAITIGTLSEVDQSVSTYNRNNISGQLSATDIDEETLTYGINGGNAVSVEFDTVTYDVALAGTYGTVYVQSSTGLYYYQQHTATVEAMDDGESGSDNFTLTVTDGDDALVGQTFTITLLGSDDRPTMNLIDNATVSEIDQSTATARNNASGTLSATDVDEETLTYGINGGTTGGTTVIGGVTYDVSMAGTYGSAYVQSSTGLYIYIHDAAGGEGLDDGETGTDNFTMTVGDGDANPLTTQTFIATVVGSDDVPILNTINIGTIAEVDQATTITSSNISGQLVATDVDTETLTYGITGGTTGGTDVVGGITYDVSLIGTYGTVYVQSSTGLYLYERAPGSLEALDDGESNTDLFSLTVTDGDDAIITQTYTINIVGSDDIPTLNAINVGTISEDDQLTTTTNTNISGQLVATDVDIETLTYGINGGGASTKVIGGISYDIELAGSFGTAYVQSSSGLYVYIKDTATIEALDDGATGSDVFTLTVGDGDLNPLTTTTFTVNIEGTDDTPTLNSINIGTISEVDQSSAVTSNNISGQMVATDVDIETLTYGISGGTTGGSDIINGVTYDVSLIGTYGTAFIQSSSGLYIFKQNGSSFEALDDNESATDQFSLTVMDGDTDPLVTQTYTVSIVGSDDVPTLNAITAGTLSEIDQGVETYGRNNISGQLSATDIDEETLTYGITGGNAVSVEFDTVTYDVALAGTYGTVYVQSSTGLYYYQQHTNTVEAMDDGESGSDNFVLTVTDGDDAVVGQTFTVNILGSDDRPTMNLIDNATVSEIDQTIATTRNNASGTLSATDVDIETLTYGINGGTTGGTTVIGGVTYDVSMAGTYGSAYVQSSTGLYIYIHDAAGGEGLDDGETGTDNFIMTVGDGDANPLTTQTFIATVVGSDDVPTLNAINLGTIAEIDQSTALTTTNISGQLVATDVDTETLTFGITGGTTGGADIVGGVTYDVSLIGTYGTVYVQSSTGLYVYERAPASLETLDDFESNTDVFTLTVTDGDDAVVGQTFTITIAGSDDAPTLDAINIATISENDQTDTLNTANLSGQLSATDIDEETLTYGITTGTTAGTDVIAGITYDVSLTGNFGTAYVQSSTGLYVYIKDTAAIEAMDVNETGSDVFTMTVTDGDDALVTQSFTVNVVGSDDIPTLNAIAAGALSENDQTDTTARTNLSGQMVATDVDIETLTYGINTGVTGGATEIDGITYDVSLAGSYGTAYVQSSTGFYIYIKDTATVEALDDGEGGSEVFTLTVGDGDANPLTTQTYTINVTGTDDVVTLNAIDAGTIAEVGQSTAVSITNISGQMVATDVDIETLTYGITGGGAVSVEIDTITYDVALAGTYGTVYVQSSTGLYIFKQNLTNFEALDDGESGSDIFTLTVTDGDDALVTQTYIVNVLGSDDAPTINALAGTLTEDDQTNTVSRNSLSGQISATDIDEETLTYGINGGGAVSTEFDGVTYDIALAGTYGTAYVQSSTGLYYYDQHPTAGESLDDGEVATDAFTITVTDGDHALVNNTFTVNVVGSDDAPTINAINVGTISEDDQVSTTTHNNASGQISATDVDEETLTYGITGGIAVSTPIGGITYDVALAGSYGTAYVQSSTGLYVYVKRTAVLEEMDDGISGSDIFNLTVTDGDDAVLSQTFTVNIIGTDDAPTLNTIDAGTIAEVGQSTAVSITNISGQLVATDVDIETLTYGIAGGTTGGTDVVGGITYDVSLGGTYGTVYVQSSTGLYKFEQNLTNFEALDDGESGSDIFSLTVMDGDGDPVTTQTFTVNVLGSDDAPTFIGGATRGTVTEDDQAGTTTLSNLSGSLPGTDIDEETLTYGISGGNAANNIFDGITYDIYLEGTYGTAFVQSSTGLYLYRKHTSAIEAMDENESDSDVFSITVTDGDHGLVSQTFIVDIIGSDDRPTLNTVAIATLNEDDQVSTTTKVNLSGQLVATDIDIETLTYGINGGGAVSTPIGGITYDVALAGTYGTAYVQSSTGFYIYIKDTATIEALDDTGGGPETFIMTVGDGDANPLTTQTWTINVVGSDDAPTLNAVSLGTIAEVDQTNTITTAGLSGQLVATDVDEEALIYGINTGTTGGATEIDTVTYDVSLIGNYGTLFVQSTTGLYYYKKDIANLEALDVDESFTDNFTMTVTDGDDALVTQNYVVNVIGSDDIPTLNTVAIGQLSEDDQLTTTTRTSLSGQMVATDVDIETLTYGINTGGAVSTPIGGVTYDVALAGSYGTAYVQSSTGLYVYIKHTATVEAMDDNESGSDVFTLTVGDGDANPLVTTTFTVNVTGSDDRPTLNAVAAGAITEESQAASTANSNLSGSLTATDTDIETLTYGINGGTTGGANIVDGITFDVSLVGSYGTVFVQSSSGLYKYVKETNAIERLDDTEAGSEVFNLTVTDGDDALVSQTYTINMTGSDDAPTINNIIGTLAEDDRSSTTTHTNLSGTISATDIDEETLTYGISTGGAVSTPIDGITYDIALAGSYGTAYVQSSTGLYIYVKQTALIEALNITDTPSEIFTLTVTDGDGPLETATFTVNIVGENDRPVVANLEAGALNYDEDSEEDISDTLTITDVDDTNLESATIQITGNYQNGEDLLQFNDRNGITSSWDAPSGTLTLTGSASIADYQAALRHVNFLTTSDDPNNLQRTITIIVNDGDDTSIPVTRNINVADTNDSPVAGDVSLAAINEGVTGSAGQDIASLISTYSDDDGDAFEGIAIIGSTANAVTEGVWQYTSNNGTDWEDITAGTYSNASALMVENNGGNTRIRFVPAGDFNGTPPDLDFRVIDDNYGGTYSNSAIPTNATANVTSNGGSTSISGGEGYSISTMINAVNDAPVNTINTDNAVYDWMEIKGNGTQITDANNTNQAANIGFEFNFYGTNYNSLTISTNGALYFGTSTTTSGANVALSASNYTRIAALWDQFYVAGGAWGSDDAGEVWYDTIGDVAGERLFVVQWDDVDRVVDFGNDPGTFQVILSEATNSVHIQYQSLDTNMDGQFATIGVQNSNTDYSQHSFNTANSISAGDILSWQLNHHWVEENNHLVFNDANLNKISVSDVDAGDDDLQITLTATNGTITLSDMTGLTFTTGDGMNDASMVFRGSSTDINNALDGLTFIPNTGYSGAGASIQIVTSDLGNNGTGGALTDTDTINITVDANANAAPTLASIESTSIAFAEGGAAVTVTNNITVADTDDANIDYAVVEIIGGYQNNDVLNFTDTVNITGTYSDGKLILTGSDTKAAYQTALRSITFESEQGAGTRTVQFAVHDGDEFSNVSTRNITITESNDAPAVNLPSEILFNSYTTTYGTANYSWTDISGTGTQIPDVENQLSTNINMGFTVDFYGTDYTQIDISSNASLFFANSTNSGANTALNAGASRTQIAPMWDQMNVAGWGSSGQVFYETVGTTGSRQFIVQWDAVENSANSVSTYQVVIEEATNDIYIHYNSLGGNHDGGGATIGIRNSTTEFTQWSLNTNNAVASGNSLFFDWTESVTPVANLSMNQEEVLTLNQANSALFSIDDPDASTGELEVTVTMTEGTLTLAQTTGLTFTTGDGTDDALMVFTGTLTDINAALDGANFTPTAYWSGTANIQIDVDDQGNTGGAALTDSANMDIVVSALTQTTQALTGGNDTITYTGTANDNILSITNDAHYVGADSANGGGGTDEIRITDTGTSTLTFTNNLTSYESIRVMTATTNYDITLSTITGITNVDATSLTTGTFTFDGATYATDLTINGGNANDDIEGGSGNDTIDGRGGVDTLTGDGGSDTFKWTSDAHSGIGSGNRDIIADFNQGDSATGAYDVTEGDLISLEDFKDTTLSYLYDSAFSALGESEVRINTTASDASTTITVLEVDEDGDGVADMEIEFTGELFIQASDFASLDNYSNFSVTGAADGYLTGTATNNDTFSIASGGFNNAEDFIDGGTGGIDVVQILAGQTVDLSGFGGDGGLKMANIEHIDLGIGANNNTITLDHDAILDMGNDVYITGDASDTVNIANWGPATATGVSKYGIGTFDQYQEYDATIYIQTEIIVNST